MSLYLLDKLPELMKDEEFAELWHESEEEFRLLGEKCEILKSNTPSPMYPL